MNPRREEWIPTRASLLERIRNTDDQSSWQEFYDTYRRLILAVTRRRGLTESEAEDVTQDTMIALQKSVKRFRYDPKRCSFKTWLSRLTEARIADFLRRRPASAPPRPVLHDAQTATAELLPDPATLDPNAVWEIEWRQGVMDMALRRFRRAVKPLRYQVFYLQALKGKSARQVARALGIGLTKVYLEKHRAGRVFERIAAATRREMERNETAVAAIRWVADEGGTRPATA